MRRLPSRRCATVSIEWADAVRRLRTGEVFDFDALVAPGAGAAQVSADLSASVRALDASSGVTGGRRLVALTGQYLALHDAQQQGVEAYKTALSAIRNSESYIPDLSASVAEAARAVERYELQRTAEVLPGRVAALIAAPSPGTRGEVETLRDDLRRWSLEVGPASSLGVRTGTLADHVRVVLEYEPAVREAFGRAVSQASAPVADRLEKFLSARVAGLRGSAELASVVATSSVGGVVLFIVLGAVFSIGLPRRVLSRRVRAAAAAPDVAPLLPEASVRERMVLQHACLAGAEQLRSVGPTLAGVQRCLSDLAGAFEAATSTGGRLRVADCAAGARAVRAHSVRLSAATRLSEAVARGMETQRVPLPPQAAVALGPLCGALAHEALGVRAIQLELDGTDVAVPCSEPLAASVALGAALSNAVQAIERARMQGGVLRVSVSNERRCPCC